MNYNSELINTQNTEIFSYTPYMIKPSNNNTSGYISYIDLLKFGQVTDFGYLQGYTSFRDWTGFIRSVHEHLQNLNERLGGVNPNPINITGYYWYIGIENPLSISDIQTDNTKPGWHSIGSSLSGFVFDGNQYTVVLYTTNTKSNYYIVIPNGLNIYDGLDNDMTATSDFEEVSCNISGYKAYKSTYQVRIVSGNIIKEISNNSTSVIGVSVSPTSANINVGETKTLTAIVSPSNATNKNVTWSIIEGTNYISLSGSTVTGLAAGTGKVQVKTQDGNFTAISIITVSNSNSQPTGYYWYIGTENSSSISDIQTDNTKPGWHSIGSSLSGFVFDGNQYTVVLYTTNTKSNYYIVIPNELSIYDGLGNNLTTTSDFEEVSCNISDYKAYKSTYQVRIVSGNIIK